ncbi:enhancer of rudimentary homolog [Lineus longissimus]|uniref:enhancer of rudimentary homolog n=1 Tax=Lineus longissimus TaxID=88925 RepID=UPI002B4F9FCF
MAGVIGMRDHTILLLQTDAKTKTFSDYETCRESLDDICKIFEDHLRKTFPHNQSITYDISQLFDFIDKFADMTCLIYDPDDRAYVPHTKAWIKEQIYILMRKQAQGHDSSARSHHNITNF